MIIVPFDQIIAILVVLAIVLTKRGTHLQAYYASKLYTFIHKTEENG